jgi:hypothetical protein
VSKERLIALQALPDDFLVCRGYGHAWQPELTASAKVPPDLLLKVEPDLPDTVKRAVKRADTVEVRGWKTEFKRCTRNGCTVLTMWYQGQLIYEHRTWPLGYLLPAGCEDHYVTEAQRELWARVLTNGKKTPR